MGKIGIRFECGHEDRMSENFGPYEFIQQTYTTLRIGPNGDEELARWDSDKGVWVLFSPPRNFSNQEFQVVTYWSDFIVFAWEDTDGQTPNS